MENVLMAMLVASMTRTLVSRVGILVNNCWGGAASSAVELPASWVESSNGLVA